MLLDIARDCAYYKSHLLGVIMFGEIVKRLGKPFLQTETCLLYNMDCVEGLRALADESIQLTVTSPPYNIGKEYEESLSVADYVRWCESWLTEIARVTADTGAFWLNLGYCSVPNTGKAVPLSYLLWDKTPLFLNQEIVWNYGAGVAGRQFFSPRNEKFLWYVKDSAEYTFNLDAVRDPNVKYPNQKKNGKIKVNPLGKNPSDVWQFPKVTSGAGRSSKERTPHPAQFPVAVIDRILLASSNKGDLILDPFLGSGSTSVVAQRRERLSIGFEIRGDYCEIAARRLFDGLNPAEEANLQRVLTPRLAEIGSFAPRLL